MLIKIIDRDKPHGDDQLRQSQLPRSYQRLDSRLSLEVLKSAEKRIDAKQGQLDLD